MTCLKEMSLKYSNVYVVVTSKGLLTPSKSGSESGKDQRTSKKDLIVSKNKRQMSRKIFAFTFAFTRSELVIIIINS